MKKNQSICSLLVCESLSELPCETLQNLCYAFHRNQPALSFDAGLNAQSMMLLNPVLRLDSFNSESTTIV